VAEQAENKLQAPQLPSTDELKIFWCSIIVFVDFEIILIQTVASQILEWRVRR
jgi:hypothetical protein